ncbi:MAG: FG-GAP-like repeat-containing protein, partial [Planctomycetota bacterium]
MFVPACGQDSGNGGTGALPETVLARDRAADLAARARWLEALEALQPLVKGGDAELEDLLRAANAQLAIKEADDRSGKARPLVERAKKLAPDDPRVLWCEYRLAAVDYDSRAALEVLRKLYALVPGDLTVGLALASTLDELDEPALEVEAQTLYQKLLEVPVELSGGWRMTVLYRLGQSLIREDKVAEGQKMLDEMTVLEARGITRPGVPEHEPDTLGALKPHTPGLFELAAPVAPSGAWKEVALGSGEGLTGLLVVQLAPGATRDVGGGQGADREELYAFEPKASVIAFGPGGVHVGAATGELARVQAGAVLDAVPLDRLNAGATKGTDLDKKMGDQDLDLVLADGANVALLENVGGSWTAGAAPLAKHGGSASLLELDYDHDGDVDVLACGASGAQLLRNDGLDGTGGFTDATAEAGLPGGIGAGWRALAEDFDRDNDVDLLFLAPANGGAKLASNERGGRFSDQSATLPRELTGGWLVPADFDGDSWPDLALVTPSEVVLHTRTVLGGWASAPKRLALAAAPAGEPRAVDLDLDGACDLVWPLADAPAGGLLAPGFANGGVACTLGAKFASARSGAAVVRLADLDGDCDQDLVRLDAAGVTAYLAEGKGTGLALALQGHKDNARGLGAIVELRAGNSYRRLYYRGQPELVGFGGKRL